VRAYDVEYGTTETLLHFHHRSLSGIDEDDTKTPIEH